MITTDEKHPCVVASQESETKLNELRMQLRKEQGERDSKLAQKSAHDERSKLNSEADQLLSGSASTDQVSAQEMRILTTESLCWREQSKSNWTR